MLEKRRGRNIVDRVYSSAVNRSINSYQRNRLEATIDALPSISEPTRQVALGFDTDQSHTELDSVIGHVKNLSSAFIYFVNRHKYIGDSRLPVPARAAIAFGVSAFLGTGAGETINHYAQKNEVKSDGHLSYKAALVLQPVIASLLLLGESDNGPTYPYIAVHTDTSGHKGDIGGPMPPPNKPSKN
jgi:hypothetical protein